MGRPARHLLILFTCALFVFGLYACKGKNENAGMPEGPTGTDLTPGFKQHADMLESALKDDPNNSGLLIQLGNLYYDWGQSDLENKAQTADPTIRWTRAVDFYKRALTINPKDVNVRVDMANLIRYMGKPDEAINEYRTAISQDPKHPQARINLIATLGEDKKDYKGAVSEYDALLKALPDQANNTALKEQVDNFKAQMKEARK
jgi:tetratricopeptide (TPR) repeat protein